MVLLPPELVLSLVSFLQLGGGGWQMSSNSQAEYRKQNEKDVCWGEGKEMPLGLVDVSAEDIYSRGKVAGGIDGY